MPLDPLAGTVVDPQRRRLPGPHGGGVLTCTVEQLDPLDRDLARPVATGLALGGVLGTVRVGLVDVVVHERHRRA